MSKLFLFIFMCFFSFNVHALGCDFFSSLPWCNKTVKEPVQYLVVLNKNSELIVGNTIKNTLIGLIAKIGANDGISLYSGNYNLITAFDMPDHDLPTELKNKNFRKELNNLYEYIAKPNSGKKIISLLNIIDNLPARLSEYNNSNLEVVIISSLQDMNLIKIKDKGFSTKAWDILLVEKTPYNTREKTTSLSDIRVHILYPELKSSVLESAYCRFWGLYVQQQSGELISCQSGDLTKRINNKNIQPKKEIPLNSQNEREKILRAFHSKKSHKKIQISQVKEPKKTSGTTNSQNSPMLLDITITSKNHDSQSEINKLDKDGSVIYTIDLEWENKEVDLDLIVTGNNEKIFYSGNSSFGRHLKHKKGGFEKIELFSIPKDGLVKVINNSIKSPGKVIMSIKDKSGNQISIEKPNYFSTQRKKKYAKKVIEYDLSDLLTNKSRLMIY